MSSTLKSKNIYLCFVFKVHNLFFFFISWFFFIIKTNHDFTKDYCSVIKSELFFFICLMGGNIQHCFCVTVVAVDSKYCSASNHAVWTCLCWWRECFALQLLGHFRCQPVWMLCNEEFLRNKSSLVTHIAREHAFNIALLANIVNCLAFPCTLRRMLDNLMCLHCKKWLWGQQHT